MKILTVKSEVIILMLLLVAVSPVVLAQPVAVQATAGSYTAGGVMGVTNTISYSGQLWSLLWRPHLPDGWTVASVSGTGSPELEAGDIVWTGSLPASPLQMVYQVQVPAGARGTYNLRGEVEYQLAGTNKPVSVSGLSLAGNYALAQPRLSASIAVAPLLVKADNQSRIFGSPNPTFTGSIVGLQNNENITVKYTCSAQTNSPAGTYPIVPYLVDSDGLLMNYAVTINNGTLLVVVPQVTVAGAKLSGRTFSVSVETLNGASYTLESADNLTHSLWTPIQAVTGNGETMMLADPNATSGMRFYRVMIR
jgi:hypothetical protein